MSVIKNQELTIAHEGDGNQCGHGGMNKDDRDRINFGFNLSIGNHSK